MAGRFKVSEREKVGSGRPSYVVSDGEDHDREVARFDDREAADAHAQRLAKGPFDWDEQENWKDDWDDEDDDDA